MASPFIHRCNQRFNALPKFMNESKDFPLLIYSFGLVTSHHIVVCLIMSSGGDQEAILFSLSHNCTVFAHFLFLYYIKTEKRELITVTILRPHGLNHSISVRVIRVLAIMVWFEILRRTSHSVKLEKSYKYISQLNNEFCLFILQNTYLCFDF